MLKTKILPGSVLLVLGLLAAGPRANIDATIKRPVLPADLDVYLADEEGPFGDMTPGIEKKIIWAVRPGARAERAVVYIHGFSATHRETAPLAGDILSPRTTATVVKMILNFLVP